MSDKKLMLRSEADASLNQWHEQEKTALELLQLVGDLRFDQSVELLLFRRDIYDARPSEVLNIHKFATNYSEHEVPVEVTFQLVQAIHDLDDFYPARVDVGILAAQWLEEKDNFDSVDQFVHHKFTTSFKSSKLMKYFLFYSF